MKLFGVNFAVILINPTRKRGNLKPFADAF